jgi:hypothetical protein
MDDHREPHEDLDRWLHERIDPLPPPPGTFDLIKKRVRRRRFRQVAASAAVAAAVAAAVVVVPRVATSVLHINQNPTGQSAASARSATPSAPLRQGPAQPSAGTPESQGVSRAASSPAPVPGNFDVTSVTFIGPHTGWVIGQAGTQGHCATQYCTSVARTTDAGQTWTGVPAPLTGAPDGASGVTQIRFLNGSDGWAFGPQLFATTDGGLHWTEEGTDGQRVTALETVGTRAFAVLASCTGTGADFAANCTSFSLYSTPAGQDAWSPVSGATGLTAGGLPAAASLVLTSSAGYLLAPDGTVYGGPVNGTASWRRVSTDLVRGANCQSGPVQASGQPTQAFLAAADSSSLVLVCGRPSAAGARTQVFTSRDAGQTWQPAGLVPGEASVTAAAAQPGGEIVLATTDGIQVSPDGGARWQAAQAPAGPDGFSWVGMTSPAQGVAIPADSSRHQLWFTFNGGQSWQPSVISGP